MGWLNPSRAPRLRVLFPYISVANHTHIFIYIYVSYKQGKGLLVANDSDS